LKNQIIWIKEKMKRFEETFNKLSMVNNFIEIL